MEIPNTYTSVNQTGCCAIPNVEEWDKQRITFENKPFIRLYTRSILYIPLNMSAVMTALQKTAQQAGVTPAPEQALTLSRDISPWKAEHLYAVTSPVEGADNVSLSGTFLTMVFEGDFKNAGKWHDQLVSYAVESGMTPYTTYFFYTTCPKCAKHYDKNYVIGLAQVAPAKEAQL